jgi:hypothetical protein
LSFEEEGELLGSLDEMSLLFSSRQLSLNIPVLDCPFPESLRRVLLPKTLGIQEVADFTPLLMRDLMDEELFVSLRAGFKLSGDKVRSATPTFE